MPVCHALSSKTQMDRAVAAEAAPGVLAAIWLTGGVPGVTPDHLPGCRALQG